MFDASTEVLTHTGWLPITSITTQTPVAQFDPITSKFQGFIAPNAVSTKTYAGTMLCINGTVSLLVTPDHMLYASRSSSSQRRRKPVYELQQANRELYGRYRGKTLLQCAFRVRKAGTGTMIQKWHFSPYTQFDAVTFAKLVGFAASDGRATRKSQNKLIFRLKKFRKSNYLAALADHEGLRRHITLTIRKRIQYEVKYPGLGLWLAENIYIGKYKTLPSSLLLAAQPVLEGVLDGLKNGDGYTRNDKCWEYGSTSRPLVNMIQAIGVIAGHPFSLTNRDGCYRMYTLGYEAQPHINDARVTQNHVQLLDWTGTVYGMDTHYGVISIRRDNKTLLIGSH